MRILIVGCGYVGLPLGAELVKEGHQVFGLRRTPGAEAELISAGIHPLRGDIAQAADLACLPSGFDWVVNCVASSGGTVQDYRAVYVEGTRNLLSWLGAQPPSKFVYTSSTGVYGQTDGSVVEEASPTEPTTETAQILVQAERLLQEAAEQRAFPAIIMRLAGIYGPGRGYWLKQYLKDEARIEGQGDRILNMIHRDDISGAVLAALKHGRPGEVYNVVDDEPVTQLEFFRWLSSALGKPLPPFLSEDSATNRKRGQTNKRVSNRKLKIALGYQLKYPTFRQGFAEELRGLR